VYRCVIIGLLWVMSRWSRKNPHHPISLSSRERYVRGRDSDGCPLLIPAIPRILLDEPTIFDTNASRCVKMCQIASTSTTRLAIPPRRGYIFCTLKNCREREARGMPPVFFRAVSDKLSGA
jgi:hypothetical protein